MKLLALILGLIYLFPLYPSITFPFHSLQFLPSTPSSLLLPTVPPFVSLFSVSLMYNSSYFPSLLSHYFSFLPFPLHYHHFYFFFFFLLFSKLIFLPFLREVKIDGGGGNSTKTREIPQKIPLRDIKISRQVSGSKEVRDHVWVRPSGHIILLSSIIINLICAYNTMRVDAQ